MIDRKKQVCAQIGQKNQRNVAPFYHHVELTIDYQSRIIGAWEEYNQRPWRSVATTIQSCTNNSTQLTSIIEEESHTMHQKVQSFKHGAFKWNGLSLCG